MQFRSSETLKMENDKKGTHTHTHRKQNTTEQNDFKRHPLKSLALSLYLGMQWEARK